MTTVCLRVLGVAAGFSFGVFLGLLVYGKRRELRRARKAKGALGESSVLKAASVSLESAGIGAWVIEKAVLFSSQGAEPLRLLAGLSLADFEKHAGLIAKSGLEQALSKSGYASTRVHFALGGMLVAALIGSVFSATLAIIGAALGFVWGWNALIRAMREESRSRAFAAERQFSQMIEVVVLGLKSGMSFDKSLALYCDSFDGSLSAVVGLAQRQWSHSLIERSDGLRQIAKSYDSPLFDRFAENVIRSLRFGTSMAESLSLLAVEARAIRKAKLEEQVAKAPVKMLLPVGTLILPAMLILVMGPIMLDLMEGF